MFLTTNSSASLDFRSAISRSRYLLEGFICIWFIPVLFAIKKIVGGVCYGKYQFFSTLVAFIAAVCFGFAVELAVRLGDMYINQGGSIAVFVSDTWQSLVVFICAGIFFFIISCYLNKEAWGKTDEREGKRAMP